MACASRHFEDRHRPKAPECWRYLNQALRPEVCITHFKTCKQVLAKNNSRTKRINLAIFTLRLTFSHISWSQKEHYKMKMIVSKNAESSKKARGEPGTLTGASVNSVYQWTIGSGDVRVFDFSPSRLRIRHPVQP